MSDQALQRIEPEQPQSELPAILKAPITPAQAKIDAVANLTMSAYAKASTLQLTPEEVAALQADFPDEAFQPGAAGKENLIYIEHAHLRDRLNQVFGPGQWSIVPRNRWAEDYSFVNKYKETVEASRVYVEAMLCVRGCFVAEAVGDMVYYKNNDSQNYGDAVEGAKTAALRRCAKELGIGLQAWKKDWCNGWWERRKVNRQPAGGNVTPPKPTTTDKGTPKTTPKPAESATEDQRVRWVKQLKSIELQATAYGYAQGILLPPSEDFPGEPVECWPLDKTPTTTLQAHTMLEAIKAHGNTPKMPQDDSGATPTASVPQNAPQTAKQAPTVPPSASNEPQDHHKSEWYNFPLPWGKHAGKLLGKLDKKYIYGLWKNFTVETEYNGKPKKKETIEVDRLLRVFLDMAGVHYRFDEPKPGTATDGGDSTNSAMSEHDDDVPF